MNKRFIIIPIGESEQDDEYREGFCAICHKAVGDGQNICSETCGALSLIDEWTSGGVSQEKADMIAEILAEDSE